MIIINLSKMVERKKVGFRYKGREIAFDAVEMNGINKALGLMIYDEVLLFRFSKGKRAIHSFFCKPFVAVWLLEGKVVEIRRINSWETSITPVKEFDMLIEIPINSKNIAVLDFLLR